MRRLAVSILATWLLASCTRQATEVLVVVDSDLSVPMELTALSVSITNPDGETRIATAQLGSGQPSLPRTLALVHEEGPLGPFSVVATGTFGGFPALERRVEFTFVEGEIRVLRIRLLRSCRMQFCAPGQTCGEAGCGPIGTAELLPWDAGTPTDTDADSPTMDAGPTPPDSGQAACPPGCRDCTGGICTVAGTVGFTPVSCPPGWPCVVDCSIGGTCGGGVSCADGQPCDVRCGAGSCGGLVGCGGASECTIDCDTNSACPGMIRCDTSESCTVACGGNNSCRGGVACGAGACSVVCAGNSACPTVTCGSSCACDVQCTGNNSCGAGAMCSAGCAIADGCNGSAECDRCS